MNQINQIKANLNRFKIYIENSAWVLFGLIIRALITIFIVSRIANQLGTDNFGWYNLSISVFTLLFAVSTLGFNPSFIIKHLVNAEYSKETIIGTTLLSRGIISILILLILYFWITFFASEHNYWILLIASASIFFQISQIITSYYQWKIKAKVYVTINSISLTIEAVLLLIGLYLELSLFYFITVYTLERVFILIGLLFVFHMKEIKLNHLKFDYSLFIKMAYQAWPLLLGAILTALYARFDQFLIKYFLNTKELGIYGTAVILTQIWFLVPSLIVPILYPKIAEFKKIKNTKKYYTTIFGLYGLLNYIAIGIIVFIFIFGEWIIKTLYGIEYLESVFILKILILNLLILFQSHLTTSVMIIEGNEKFLFRIKLVSVVVNIALNVLFLSYYGVKIAAYSLLISSFISWIVLALFNKSMKRLLKLNFKSYLIPFYLKKILK